MEEWTARLTRLAARLGSSSASATRVWLGVQRRRLQVDRGGRGWINRGEAAQLLVLWLVVRASLELQSNTQQFHINCVPPQRVTVRVSGHMAVVPMFSFCTVSYGAYTSRYTVSRLHPT